MDCPRHPILRTVGTDTRHESQSVSVLVLQSDSTIDLRDPFLDDGSSKSTTVLVQGTSIYRFQGQRNGRQTVPVENRGTPTDVGKSVAER